ncbi:MAG: DUF4919 domain-containing protein [Vulcanimicrobiota bacterium]
MRPLLILLLLTALAWSQDYAGLLKQAQRNDPTTDFSALRQAFSQLPGYNGYASPPELEPMLKALAAPDLEQAGELARAVLSANYLQLDAHYVLLLWARAHTNKAEETHHDFMLRGLSAAIRAGHDGSGPEQAWTALNVGEEYSVCRLAGWRMQSQGLVHQGARAYDRLNVVNSEGKGFSIYFDITGWFGKL